MSKSSPSDEELPATEEEKRRLCEELGIVYRTPAGTPVFRDPPPADRSAPEASPASAFAIFSIVCGLIAFALCPPLFGVAGLVLGGVAMARGETLAPLGLAVSVVGMAAGIYIGAAVGAQTFN
jgi:hypothetical protein